MSNEKEKTNPTGRTKSAGYEIGVRKTLPIPAQKLWEYLISVEGVQLWLGVDAPLEWVTGAEFKAQDGSHGVIRVFNPSSHLRLSWQPGDWPRPSTLQVRVIPAGEKATLSFHQEHLPGAAEREEMRKKWGEVVERIDLKATGQAEWNGERLEP